METKAIHFLRQELLQLPFKPGMSKGTMPRTDLRRISLLCSEEILTASSVCDLNELQCDGILSMSHERVTFICSCLWIHGGITILTLSLISRACAGGNRAADRRPLRESALGASPFKGFFCHLSCNKMVMNISEHE